MMVALAGCGGVSSNVQNPPPPPPSKLAIAFQPPPAASIPINSTTNLTAVVSNDSSNLGVDWDLTCTSAGQCGSLSSLHTASGQSVTYTPPASLAGNSAPVNIVAFATADHTKNVLAPITITAFGNNLKGTYVLQAQGISNSGQTDYQFAGVVVLDGSGGIVGGEQTVNFFNANQQVLVSKSDVNLQGTYFLGPDGRGTITINTNDNDIDPSFNGVETFTFVFLSSSQAFLAQADFQNVTATGVSASGTMDLQTAIAAPTGGYAFVVSGSDFASGSGTAIGGILNIDSPNNISGKGSVTDQNLAGTVTANQHVSGTVSNPDAFGAVTLNLSVPTFPSTTAYQFTGYIVDSIHIKLIENDNPLGAGGLGSTGGVAIGQGAATGTFNNASFSGTYVFGVLGQDLSTTLPATTTSVGLFTADDSSGTPILTNGFTDTLLQTVGAQISAAFGGTYSVGPVGRVHSYFNHITPQPAGGFVPQFLFYLTGNGNPALVLAQANDSFATPLFLGAGVAYAQSASLTFAGDYGVSFTQQNGSEYDGTAQLNATATSPPSISGSADVSISGGALLAQPFSGALNSDCIAGVADGCFTGTLGNSVGGSAFVSPNQPFPVDYYIIDPSHGFFVETDLLSGASGVVSLGYYAARTPVCTSCQ
jgi:hypothetical protein